MDSSPESPKTPAPEPTKAIPPLPKGWHDAVEAIKPHVVRIQTPRGSGTGFFFYRSEKGLTWIATAAHVVDDAHYWEEPIRIHHEQSGKSQLLRAAERVIILDQRRDTAAILGYGTPLPFPDTAPYLVPDENFLKVGVEIGWLGYPAIARSRLCYFGGRISSFSEGEYLVDGVAINGVSGGPAFHFPEFPLVMGVLSAYIPNRATGETLPGLAVVRDVSTLHGIIEALKTPEEAKEQETTQAAPPPPPPEPPPAVTP